jgi:hypothetical protein
MTTDTKDIDLAAYLATACGTFPEVLRDQCDGLAIFKFEQRPDIHAALIEYAAGAANIPARQLLGARRRLYFEVRRVAGGAK